MPLAQASSDSKHFQMSFVVENAFWTHCKGFLSLCQLLMEYKCVWKIPCAFSADLTVPHSPLLDYI